MFLIMLVSHIMSTYKRFFPVSNTGKPVDKHYDTPNVQISLHSSSVNMVITFNITPFFKISHNFNI
jgi:hypothetical protein